MIVRYLGKQSAINVAVKGVSYRLLPFNHTLLKQEHFNEFKERDFTNLMIDNGQLELIEIDELNKDELIIVARENNFALDGNEKVADLKEILGATVKPSTKKTTKATKAKADEPDADSEDPDEPDVDEPDVDEPDADEPKADSEDTDKA